MDNLNVFNLTFGDDSGSHDGEPICGPDYSADGFIRGNVNWISLIVLVLFYVAILMVGIIASWRNRSLKSQDTEDLILAKRNIGSWMALATLTATWVGGGYINGTAERIFKPHYGMVWTQAPIGYSLSLVLAGALFGKKMRDAEYVTMLDPIQRRHGAFVAGLCYIPALLGDVFWSAAILGALGSSLSVIVGLNHVYSVLTSAGIALLYTLIGGLYSVMYTDIIQLGCIFVGLWLAIPFAQKHDAVSSLTANAQGEGGWLGEWPKDEAISYWFDGLMLLTFGGIPWQAYFQRVLALRSSSHVRMISVLAGVGCFVSALPAVWIGAIGHSTDWLETDYAESGCVPIPKEDYKMILPLVMQFLTPTPVAVIGLGAVSAAVMSSADSSILSASSMFSHNIYEPFRMWIHAKGWAREMSNTEQLWVLRAAMVTVACMACVLAIVVNSIYGLFYLAGDLVYVLLFPQLLLVIYAERRINAYGALTGFLVGMFLRLSAGEHLLKFPALIEYPWYHADEMKQYFPVKTFCMVMTMLTILTVSAFAEWLFKSGKLSEKHDVLGGFADEKDEKENSLQFLDGNGLPNEMVVMESTQKQNGGKSNGTNGYHA